MAPLASRRTFLGTASITLAMSGFARTSPLVAGENQKSSFGRDFESLVGLILDTPRDRCVEVLADELRSGLSYRQLLAGLFHAAVRHQGTHEIAMMFSAQRISGQLPVRESLLPLFWAFDSLARRIQNEKQIGKHPVIRPLAQGALPHPATALKTLGDAMQAQDRPTAELAAVSLARSLGNRQAVELVWRYACRDSDNLGHKAISCANSRRILDTIGWEHAEIPVRYVLGGSAPGTDATYEGSRQRVETTLPKLPPDWSSSEADHKATLELYEEIRAARTTAAADLVCQQLTSGKVTAGSVWDAIHLSAADLLLRYRTRTRGWPVHAVTSSNALHFAFRTALDSETRLLLLLQATSRLSDQMTRLSLEGGYLRDARITNLEPAAVPAQPQDALDEIFSLLPRNDPDHKKGDASDRESDEQACRKAFALLHDPSNRSAFMNAACGYIVRKATWNAHDFKFPAAAFEDAGFISERWRPHFLAATVHALHGRASPDTPVFTHAREVLATL
jgi:hypothetical protein